MSSTEQLKSVLQRIKVSNKIEADLLKDLSNQEKELLTYLHGEGLVDEALQFLKDLNEDQEWHLLKERMIASKTKVIPIWKSILRYAAIFIGLFGAIYLFRIGMGQDPDTPATDKSITLKIGEDAVRFIREGESQQIVSASGEVVGEQKGNSIRYDTDTQIDELIFNELEIPYGKIFEVVLSDGTLVHLNSGTKMRYPVKFLEGQKREVFIHGEAYFDVAKDKNRPFIVNADDLAVEVLGTEFNITSYQEDREIRTVLVEGSVSLSHSATPRDVIFLDPGQKAAWNKTERTTRVEEVDIDQYTSWINGEMIFRNTSFEVMSKKLERRYNVSIQNNNLILKEKMLNARFNVEVERIEDVLDFINEIQPFEYDITGNEITID